jgi:hypothetical protein
LAVEAMKKDTHDEAVADVDYYLAKYLYGRTVLDLEPDSVEAFADWNSSRGKGDYRPYDLKYRSIQLYPHSDERGWWFIISSDSLMLLEDALRVTHALWSAGIPVNLSSARQLVKIVDQTDYVGIQPSYGHNYNTVYDGEVGTYTSLGIERDSRSPNHDAEVIVATIWKPVDEIELK